MSGNDKMHLIHDEWGRPRNIDICSEIEPTETWPYMLWLKVSTATLKVRNVENTAWVTVGTGGGGGAPAAGQYLVLELNPDLTDERRMIMGDGLDASDGGPGGDYAPRVDVSDFAGSGLEDDGAENLRIAAAAAGDGLQGGGGVALAVDVSDFAGGGLEDDGAENLRIAAAAAGDGLQGGSGSALAIDVSDFAGDGLEDDGAENLQVDATVVRTSGEQFIAGNKYFTNLLTVTNADRSALALEAWTEDVYDTGHVGLNTAALANVLLTLGGTFKVVDDYAFAMYLGGLTLTVDAGQQAYFGYFGGTVDTGGAVVTSATSLYVGAVVKAGGGSITTVYGLYIDEPLAGTTNWAAYIKGDTQIIGNLVMGKDDAWIGIGSAAGRIVFDTTPTPDELVFYSCHVGIGASPTPGKILFAYDPAVDTTIGFTGIQGSFTKTAGATDENDTMYAGYFSCAMNDSDSTIGNLVGVQGIATLTIGSIGTDAANRNLMAGGFNATLTDGTVNGQILGLSAFVDVNAGTVDAAITGLKVNIDIESGPTLSGNVYGAYIQIDEDAGAAGTVYMIYLLEQSGIDYSIYQSGTADNAFGGNILPTGNKAKNLGASANRWNTLYQGTSTAAGTSRLVDSKRDCPVCKRKMKRGTGSLLVLGEDRDYALAHCLYCGVTAMEEVKHLPEEKLARRQPPPKIEFVGFHIFEMSGQSRQVRADFRYTDDVPEIHISPDGEEIEVRKPGITNATYLGEEEIESFMAMTDKQRKAFLLELGKLEWYALEDVKLMQEHTGELQAKFDALTIEMVSRNLLEVN